MPAAGFFDAATEPNVSALLIFNAVINFVEEGRASKALALLRNQLSTRARVLRDGRWQTILAEPIVHHSWSDLVLQPYGFGNEGLHCRIRKRL